MDLRALRYFEAVYEQRSISAAARRCFIAQPSISAAIQQLEASLEATLFVRHPKGVVPTEAGERLYPLSKKLTGEAHAIRQLFVQQPPAAPFRLGLMRSLGVERMSLWLRELSLAVEQLELTLVNPEEDCDARIIELGELEEWELFQPIWQDRYLVALPLGHPLSLKERLSLRDLKGLAFINREPCAALDGLKRALASRDLGFTARANIRTIEYALGLVAAGVGAALVPAWDSTRARDDLVLRELAELELQQQIGLAYDRSAPVTPMLQAALAICQRTRAGAASGSSR